MIFCSFNFSVVPNSLIVQSLAVTVQAPYAPTVPLLSPPLRISASASKRQGLLNKDVWKQEICHQLFPLSGFKWHPPSSIAGAKAARSVQRQVEIQPQTSLSIVHRVVVHASSFWIGGGHRSYCFIFLFLLNMRSLLSSESSECWFEIQQNEGLFFTVYAFRSLNTTWDTTAWVLPSLF